MEKKELILRVAADPYDSMDYALFIVYHTDRDIPKEILKTLKNNPMQAFVVADHMLNKDKRIPQEIIKGVTKDNRKSYSLAYHFMQNGINIPQEIIKVLKPFQKRELMIKESTDNEELLNTVLKNSETIGKYLELLIKRNKEIPEESLEKISKNFYNSYIAAQIYVENDLDVPKILIDGVSNAPKSSYSLAALMIMKNVKIPLKLLKSIDSDDTVRDWFIDYCLHKTKVINGTVIVYGSKGLTKNMKNIKAMFKDVINKKLQEKLISNK